MPLSQLLAAVRANPQAVSIPNQWSQGRACFGGLMAALLYEAMCARVSAERPVRSLAITFVAPAEPQVPISFEVDVLREGKAVVSLLGRAVQKGAVVTLIQGSFGAFRDSAIDVPSLPAVEMKSLEESDELHYVEGMTPEYIRFLAMRWGVGALPFTNTPSRQMGGWMRLRGDVQKEPATEAHLLALVDAWPPAVLPYLSRPAAGSTLTWTIEFVQPMPAFSTHDWVRYCAEVEHARDGYGHTAAGVWTAEGKLLALSRQTVTVFA
ncbi:acyl-CoA thioesterase II [Pseudomonas sp. R5(2019)]|uniref:acyl-CoA thioesterase n=1 Tax=Pseudomonas sp. R5(2019) TaxID=2697566 RepID=UPI001412A5E5|nr:thioesterase family protein [Pseudomonas sp. R5(2019)]NBA97322.1 thioesterase family protein [Pseudomonas sp. R5(2019)]